MDRGRECGEIFLRDDVLKGKRSSLDGMTSRWDDLDERGQELWQESSGKQDSLRELFTKIYIVILACTIALFGSALLLLRSPSPDNQLSSSFVARSAAPQDATTTTISSLTISSSTSSASPSSTTPVEIFQVFSPVLGTTGLVGSNGPVANTTATEASGSSCQVTLMEHSFSDSFGKPFVGTLTNECCVNKQLLMRGPGNYTPPACINDANTVMMNFSVVSQGVQFDRLALM
jgi:Peptide N-acetyl-beta-D-glucosaminyl asparaginase amidase A